MNTNILNRIKTYADYGRFLDAVRESNTHKNSWFVFASMWDEGGKDEPYLIASGLTEDEAMRIYEANERAVCEAGGYDYAYIDFSNPYEPHGRIAMYERLTGIALPRAHELAELFTAMWRKLGI